ncbi:MAG: MBL fold metallo-hydrolase [Anaerolineae bacterium]
MPKLIILGSAASVPDAFHDNTYMVLRGKKSSILIDCGGSPVHKLQRVGIPLDSLEALVVTHYHPDHIYGLPALILSLWMYGQRELNVFGLAESLHVILKVMDAFRWKEWLFPFNLSLHELPPRRKKVLESEDFKITASPVKHVVPNIALKFVSKKSGRSIVYSSDTEPCESLFRLAKGADVLIHESGGPLPGHSTSRQAGAMARRCGVKKLVLIHFPPLDGDLEGMCRAAQEEFGGPVELASDFSIHHF